MFCKVGSERGPQLEGRAGPHKLGVVQVRVAHRLVRAERRRAGELGGDAPEGLAQAGEQLECGEGARLRLIATHPQLAFITAPLLPLATPR